MKHSNQRESRKQQSRFFVYNGVKYCGIRSSIRLPLPPAHREMLTKLIQDAIHKRVRNISSQGPGSANSDSRDGKAGAPWLRELIENEALKDLLNLIAEVLVEQDLKKMKEVHAQEYESKAGQTNQSSQQHEGDF